ncbi:MAG: substrate-binding domain-containing protein [Armatimonadota bacterium]
MKAAKLIAQALAALFIIVLLVGCSKSQQSSSSSGTPSVAPKPKSGLKIAGIIFQEDQFFRMVEYGMQKAADENGIDLQLQNSGSAVDKESDFIQTYVSDKVDAIAIAPVSAEGSVTALKKANDSGIKIVTFDSSINANFPVCDIKSDQILLGKYTGQAAAKYIKEKLGGKAKIAVIQYKSFLPEPSGKRTKGFLDEVKKLPGVKVVADQDAWETAKAADVVQGVLTANPGVNLIWAANEGGTVGAVTAVNSMGKAGKVVVFGTDMSQQIGDFLTADDNILQAVTAQKPIEIGKAAIESAMKAIKGEKIEKKVELPGLLYSREDPKAIKEFQDMVKEIQ